MDSQDRIERAVLKPAHEQFAERRISRTTENKSTNVGRPIRNAGKFEIQTSRNLPPETEPVRINVS